MGRVKKISGMWKKEQERALEERQYGRGLGRVIKGKSEQKSDQVNRKG